MKKNSFRKRLCCSVVAILSLFAVYGNNLHAADITYHPSMFDDATQTEAVATGTTVALTDMGFKRTGYVLMGWHTKRCPFITSASAEASLSRIATFYPLGSSLSITGDLTLYAIWALDKNNDGFPDYGGAIIKPTSSKELIESIIAASEEELYLRSSMAPWHNSYDVKASEDSIYYVGCPYNVDYDHKLRESLITLDLRYSFDHNIARAIIPMYLIIECDGVLEEHSYVNGQTYKAVDTIKITQDMVNRGFTMDSLINYAPFVFNSIKEDGLGILKMYFWDPVTDTFPPITDFRYGMITPPSNTKPFIDPKGGYTDTCVIKFHIYNKPEFKSTNFSQRIDLQGYLDLKHVSGTPLKYMMRSIEGLGWKPADSPLSKAEQSEVGDGASICLRELDKTIGYQMMSKAYYFTPAFNPTTHNGEFAAFQDECLYDYNLSVLVALPPLDQADVLTEYTAVSGATGFPTPPPAFNTPAGVAYSNDLYLALTFASFIYPNITAAYDPSDAYLIIADSIARADWYTVLGQRNADSIPVPASCRGANCYTFGTREYPTITREVFIPQVSGVTTTPEYGRQYVESQKDFQFSAKYTTAQPLKVTTNRIIEGKEEELTGTLNDKGAYDYVIPRVTQNIVLTFGPETVANASIDGTMVWSHNNAINIRVEKNDVASIYSIAGQMVKRIELSGGDNTVPMERGVYIVTLKDGSIHKVIVK